MKEKIVHYLRYVLDNVKAIEVAIIAALAWWAFILAVPLETFSGTKAYDAMAGIASEEVWAVAFFIVAICNLYGMIADKTKLRMISLIVSNGLWVFVSAMFAISDIATTGTGIYFIVSCLNTYVIYKVGEENGR